MSEKYYKIRESILADIAEAIRLKRNETKEYPPERFARLINMFVLKPVGYAFSEIAKIKMNIRVVSDATGRSWTPIKSSASSINDSSMTVHTPDSSATSILDI